MLRVGLTGGLGSGKTTVAARLRALGAEVIEADELGRQLMQPGQQVFNAIIRHFGPSVVAADGRLDRVALARIAFDSSRLAELNAIVHPAVIAAQQQWMHALFARNPAAIAVVESALIFEVERDARARGENQGVLADWKQRFDHIILVTAPEKIRIARYVARLSPSGWNEQVAADAEARMRRQMSDEEKIARADFVLANDAGLDALLAQTDALWEKLKLLNATERNHASST